MTINLSDKVKEMWINDEQGLISHVFPGGYPMYYLDAENSVLCPDCASQNTELDPMVTGWGINYEDDSLCCDQCSRKIESAYCD